MTTSRPATDPVSVTQFRSNKSRHIGILSATIEFFSFCLGQVSWASTKSRVSKLPMPLASRRGIVFSPGGAGMQVKQYDA